MLRDWNNFYIMAGTSGATFIGLLFVVVTLGPAGSTSRGKAGVDAFLTPTLVHFFRRLVACHGLAVPWPSVWSISSILSLCALIGLGYQFTRFWRSAGRILFPCAGTTGFPTPAFPPSAMRA